ncbi:Transcriptional regulatory protein DegU [Methylovirgula sp. HY1]|nr:Transcriptional regulatory protein DegU [Methylovirgula sp. HY1]
MTRAEMATRMMTEALSDQVKVLVIEDHPIVRDGCRRICSRRPDIDTREASTAEEGLAANRSFHPDVVILDIGLGETSGFDIMPKLLADNEAAQIVVFSMYEEARFVTRALDLGARGYITKNDDPNAILAAIDKVRSGAIYLGQSVAQALALASREPASDPLRELTERERQVVSLLGDGKNLSQIASLLDIGYKTAANTVASIKQKLRFATSPALIKFAVELKAKG